MKLQENPTALVDGDIICYKCAFACQKSIKLIEKDGSLVDSVFYYSQFHGYHLIDAYMKRIKKDLSTNDLVVILSVDDKSLNYRTHVKGAEKEYKGNRKPRPFYYKHMRSYMINNYDATIHPQDEADDALGMLCYEDFNSKYDSDVHEDLKYIQCTIDKDSKQIPGYLYNLNSRTISFSGNFGYLSYSKKSGIDGRGFLFFCAQMLMGDTADNIVGIKGIGPKKAYSALHKFSSFSEAWRCVVIKYAEHGNDNKVLTANASLLWITHEKGRRLPHHVHIDELI